MSLWHRNPDGIIGLLLAAMLKNLAVANVLAVALRDQVHVRGSTASAWKVWIQPANISYSRPSVRPGMEKAGDLGTLAGTMEPL